MKLGHAPGGHVKEDAAYEANDGRYPGTNHITAGTDGYLEGGSRRIRSGIGRGRDGQTTIRDRRREGRVDNGQRQEEGGKGRQRSETGGGRDGQTTIRDRKREGRADNDQRQEEGGKGRQRSETGGGREGQTTVRHRRREGGTDNGQR